MYNARVLSKVFSFTALVSLLNAEPLTIPSTIDSDTNIGPGTVLIDTDIQINPGATLTLAPGTVIKINNYWTSFIVSGGELIAHGTAQNPIYFTSHLDKSVGEDVASGDNTNPNANDWGGIISQFSGSHTGSIDLKHCIFRFGGGESNGSVEANTPALLVESCTFSNSGDSGVSLNETAGSTLTHQPVIEYSTFENNPNSGIRIHATSDEPLTPVIRNCEFKNNDAYAIDLKDNAFPEFIDNSLLSTGTTGSAGVAVYGTINTSGTLASPGENFPYLLTNDLEIKNGATLTLEGSTIFKGNSYWNSIILNGGHLITSLEHEHVFTSINDDTIGGDTMHDGSGTLPAANDWGGIEIRRSDTILSSAELYNCHFKYGSGETRAMVVSQSPKLTVSNSSFSYSGYYGIHLTETSNESNGIRPEIINSIFELNNVAGISVEGLSEPLNPLIKNCSFENNEIGAISLQDNAYPEFSNNVGLENHTRGRQGIVILGTLNADGNFAYPGQRLPYILDGDLSIQSGAEVTFDAGCIVKGSGYWNNFIIDEGKLVLAGTLDNPITFTSLYDDSVGGDSEGNGDETVPAPSDWGGILVMNASGTLEINHASLRYGGGETFGMIESYSPRLTLNNSTFEYSKDSAIFIDITSTVENAGQTQIINSVFSLNQQSGIEIQSDDNAFIPVIQNCRFQDNEFYSIKISGNVFPDFDNSNDALDSTSGLKGVAIDGTVSVPGNLERAGTELPYILINDYEIRSSLTLEPGLGFKGDNHWVSIRILDGSLTAEGTSSNLIYFTSLHDDSFAGDSNNNGSETVPDGGDWGGIELSADSGKSPSLLMSYAEIRYAGGELNGNLTVKNTSVDLEFLRILHSKDYGIYFDNARESRLANVHFEGNLSAVENNADVLIRAKNNYWGHAGGPNDASDIDDLVKALGETYINDNPEGQVVSNNVLYTSWMSTPPVFDEYLWKDATLYPGDWRFSQWYGWFWDSRFPIILHVDHGYVLCSGKTVNSVYFYDFQIREWFWTRASHYPYMYKFTGSPRGWFYFLPGTVEPQRWFYGDLGQGRTWFLESEFE